MHLLPFDQQIGLAFGHDPQRLGDVGFRRSERPSDFRLTVRTDEIDDHFAILDHVHMRRRMIVPVDDDAKAALTVNGDHFRL
jgi:hypothetical protein